MGAVPPLQAYPIKSTNFPGVAPGCSARPLQGRQPLRKPIRLALSELHDLKQALAGDVEQGQFPLTAGVMKSAVRDPLVSLTPQPKLSTAWSSARM